MKKRAYLGFLWIISAHADTQYGECMSKRLQDFINQCVQKEHHTSFKDYYSQLMAKELRHKRKHASSDMVDSLRQLGLNSLEINNAKLAQHIRPYLSAPVKNQQRAQATQRFLVRYGAYQQFLKEEVQKNSSIMAKARSYLDKVSNKIVNWVSRIRSQEVC